MASAAALFKPSPVLDKSEWVKGQSLSLPTAKSVRTHAIAPAGLTVKAAISYADELVKTAVSDQKIDMNYVKHVPCCDV